MGYIRSIAPGVLRYTCGDIYYNHNQATLENKILADLSDNNLSLIDLKNNIILIDFLAEGQNEIQAQPLVDYLSPIVGLDNIRILFNAVVNTNLLSYKARSFVEHHACWDGRLTYNPTLEKNISLDKKFLCLARRPNHSRAKFVSQLVNSTKMFALVLHLDFLI